MPSLRFIKLPPGMQSPYIQTGQEFVFDGTTKLLKVGRQTDWPTGFKEELASPSPSSRLTTVSREHFAIVCERGRYYIEDLRSQNGTYCNGLKIVPYLRYPLRDALLIHMTEFVFQFLDETTVPASDSAIKLVLEAIGCRYSILTHHPLSKPETIFDFLLGLPDSLEHNDPLSQVGKKILEESFFPKATHCFFHGMDAKQQPHTSASYPQRPTPSIVPSVIPKCLEQGEAMLVQITDESNTAFDAPRSSSMFVPLWTHDQKPIGVLHLHAHQVENAFTETDLGRLIGLGGLLSKFVEKSKLSTRFTHPNSDPQFGNIARSIQRLMMPERIPIIPEYEFFATHQTPNQLGGDFYDLFTLRNGKQVILAGKVLGFGVASALLMARFTGQTRQAFESTANPADALTRLNRIWSASRLTGWTISLTAFVLDPLRHTLEYANAGNVRPLLYRSDLNRFELLSHPQQGVPICFLETEIYQQLELRFYPGDCIFVFAKGLVEARNAQDKTFTSQAVLRLALSSIEQTQNENFVSARHLGQSMLDAVTTHCGEAWDSQSLTMIAFSRLPIPADIPSVVTVENPE